MILVNILIICILVFLLLYITFKTHTQNNNWHIRTNCKYLMPETLQNVLNEIEDDNKRVLQYIYLGRKLLELNVEKIIFIEESIYDKYLKEYNYESNKTRFIFIKRENIYLNDYRDKITNFNIITTNPSKDTIDYMFVQCNKTEWITKAIEINPFNTDNYIWIDFGIYHIFNNNLDLFQTEICKLNSINLIEKIRMILL